MENTYEKKLTKKAHGKVIECVAAHKENGKKELNYCLPREFTEMAATLLGDLLEKDGYQVTVKALPTRTGTVYIIHVRIQ